MRKPIIKVWDNGMVDKELTEIANEIAEFCVEKYRLDLTDINFNIVNLEDLCSIIATGGWVMFPQHWSLGQQYFIQKKGHTLGYWQVYEIVVPSEVWEEKRKEPAEAYIYSGDSLTDIKLVMAHVYGHIHAFENNWKLNEFKPSSPLAFMAEQKERIAEIEKDVGEENVERLMDIGYTLSTLVDRYPVKKNGEAVIKELPFEKFVISPGEKKKRLIDDIEKKSKRENTPEDRDYDVFKFIVDNADTLADWEREILSMTWEQNRYLSTWGLCRYLNEGFAALVDLKYCLDSRLPMGETFRWLKQRTTGTYQAGQSEKEGQEGSESHGGRTVEINPYWLGMNMLLDVIEKWDTGRFDLDYEQLEDARERHDFNMRLDRGWDKVLEIVATNTDYTFINSYFTEDFFTRVASGLFVYAGREPEKDKRVEDTYTITSRKYQSIKDTLLFETYNNGLPRLYVEKGGGNYNNKKELYLVQDFSGYDKLGLSPKELTLQPAETSEVLLKALYEAWRRPVHLETVNREGKPIVLSTFDGVEIKENRQDGKKTTDVVVVPVH
jgi:stage V sporulation protein R